jgi:hypothetical protein
MKYKNFYGTKEEYIKLCIQNVKHWSKTLVEDFKPAFVDALNQAEEILIKEGFSWEEVEKIEIEAMKNA